MRLGTSVSAVVVACAAGLGVTGCSPATTASSGGGTATPVPSSTGLTSAGSASASPAGGGTSSGQRGTSDVAKCMPEDLKYALGDGKQMSGSQWTQPVDMTNQTSSACSMDGSPTVDLIGDTDSQPNDDWTLTGSSSSGSQVTLQPGDTAHFDLVYLNGDLASGGGGENVISVDKMVIATPGDDDQSDNATRGSLDWAATVVLQDGATHPGTYVMPVASGA